MKIPTEKTTRRGLSLVSGAVYVWFAAAVVHPEFTVAPEIFGLAILAMATLVGIEVHGGKYSIGGSGGDEGK